MPDEQAILEYVKLKAQEQWETLRKNAEAQCADLRHGPASRNMSLTGGLFQAILDAWSDAVQDRVRGRIQIEVDTRRRHGRRLEQADGERILAELQAIIERATGNEGVVASHTRQWGDHGKDRVKRLGEDLKSYAGQKVQLAVMEGAMPEIPNASIANIVNVNAPVYGDVVARIERINIGGGSSDLRDSLKLVLEGMREASPENEAEAREIVDGVVVEVERGTQANKGLVRSGLRRLTSLASGVNDTARVVAAIEKVAAILQTMGVI